MLCIAKFTRKRERNSLAERLTARIQYHNRGRPTPTRAQINNVDVRGHRQHVIAPFTLLVTI